MARGTADAESDIDTLVYLHAPCSKGRFESECQRARASGGGYHNGSPRAGFAVYHIVEGVKCDFAFSPVARVEELLDEVLLQRDTDPVK
ncbi:MAG: hypothetical protein ACE5F5_11680, partial [Acidimicrobiia bacterium]